MILIHKFFLAFIVIFSSSTLLQGQSARYDSLQMELYLSGTDKQKQIEILFALFDESIYTQPDSALKFARRSVSLTQEIGDMYLEGNAVRKMGIYYYVVGDYDKAMDFYIQTQTLTKRTNNTAGYLSSIMNIGLVNAARKEHDLAISAYKTVFKEALQIADSSLMSRSQYNMAISLQDQEKFDSSNVYFDRALKYLKANSTLYERSRIYALKGQGFYLDNDFKKSEEEYLTAFKIGFKGSFWDEAFALAGLAQTEIALGNTQKALELAHRAYTMAQENKFKWELQRVTKILSEAYLKMGDYKNSRKYLLEHTELNTTIYNEQRENEIFKLRLSQKESERLQLEKDNLKKDGAIRFRNMILLVAILGVVVLVSFLMILKGNFRKIEELNLNLRKTNAELDKTNETKNRLFSIIGHDLKNMLSAMQGFVALFRNKDISFEEWVSVTPHLAANIDVLKLTLENLMQWGISQSKGLKPDIQQFAFTQLCSDLKDTFRDSIYQKEINLVVECPSYVFIKSDVVYLELVLRNLLHNAIKFTPKGGTVSMKLLEMDDSVRIVLADSGVGMSDKQLNEIRNSKPLSTEFGTEGEAGTGMGIQLVVDLLDMLESKLQINSEQGKGTTFWFDLHK